MFESSLQPHVATLAGLANGGRVPLLGVLGGMGPAATVDFMGKLVANTRARCDQEHIAVVVTSIPQIPDRAAASRGEGRSPLPDMVASGKRLLASGVDLIVMPCNTAHLWFDQLERALSIPMIHIVDATMARILDLDPHVSRIGLLATDATVASRLYVERSRLDGRTSQISQIEWVEPRDMEFIDWISPAIRAIKAGHRYEARSRLRLAAEALVARGAEAIVMGCTEIPLALETGDVDVPLIDATDALAHRVVEWASAR